MSEQDFNELFAKNLNFYLDLSGRTQADLAKYIGVSTAAVSNWCKGIKLPRMDKVDKMCTFFQIRRSDLMQEHSPVTINPSASDGNSQRSLSSDALTLLDDYDRLNESGKLKVREYASDLVNSGNYEKDSAEDLSRKMA